MTATTLPPDPWKALGVERNADKSEIRSAYKKLVLKCHPDKVQDPTLKALKADEFQKVQQAYELLNDDAEKAKYEQKLKLAELQRAAKVQQDVKNSPNTSVPRSSTKYTYDIHTAEPTSRYKSSPSGGKVYATYTTTHTRSHEEMPSSRSYSLYDESDRQARRTASYEKPSKRDEERRERERDREERRRRKEEEDLRLREKERDREREKAEKREEEKREARKAEKKRLEKERERERERDRRREADEKSRRHTPYVEHYDPYMDEIVLEDEKHVSSRSEKKRSSSRKHDETRERQRERDKSSSRRAKSPHARSDRDKHANLYESAQIYVVTAGSSLPSQKAAFWKSEVSHVLKSEIPHTPPAPTPPPALDLEEEESIRRSSARAAGRRTSNDAARSREKLNKYDMVDATPTARAIPTLSSYDPPLAPESPPRLSRSQTARYESSRTIPSLSRNQTWGPSINSTGDYYADFESEEEIERRRRRSRRTRSPSAQATHRYKVEGTKTSKLEPQYSYGESPTSRRYAAADVSHSPSSTYPGVPFRVKETKSYGLGDVSYAEYGGPYYSTHAGEGYPVGA